jgi:Flp pilus assembly protein TadG
MTTLVRLLRCRRAAAGAEFALVLPLLLLLLFGVIDAGRFLWEFNEAEKATQMGVRYAVVTDPVPSALSTYSFAISDGISQGSAVPTTNFDSATCNNSTCSCTPGGGFCTANTYNGTAFTNIVNRMSAFYPPIGPSNVTVKYKNVGLGFAGDPDNPNVSALVTVKLTGLAFHPIICLVFACSISMPNFSAALTLEDASNNGVNPPVSN